MLELSEILVPLAEHVRDGTFEQLESEAIEIKTVPPSRGKWDEIRISICAFLNQHGGTIILGVKEVQSKTTKRYEFTGWDDNQESNLRDLRKGFTDDSDRDLDLTDRVSFSIVPFLDGHLALVYVTELSADRKFACFEGQAYRRVATADERITPEQIEQQRQYRESLHYSRELGVVADSTEREIDLNLLNDFIQKINERGKIETLKDSWDSARILLENKSFIKSGKLTILGALVCGTYPADRLGFRAQVHCYTQLFLAEATGRDTVIADDKYDIRGNLQTLLDEGLGYLQRSILIGIRADRGGTRSPQFSLDVLRESFNNALAHRDYSINRQVIVENRPGESIRIQNPGSIPRQFVVDIGDVFTPYKVIVPESKAKNPKLADCLRFMIKWEGRGKGMSDLVNACLRNEIDVPYYELKTEEVVLVLPHGRLIDERIKRWFDSFSGWILKKRNGEALSDDELRTLSYFVKSEWAHRLGRHTILLSRNNNHQKTLHTLIASGLIELHPFRHDRYECFRPARELMRDDYREELLEFFGKWHDLLDRFSRQILYAVYRFETFSKEQRSSAKRVSYDLEPMADAKYFSAFDRKVRKRFNDLHKEGFLTKLPGVRSAYVLNRNFLIGRLPLS